MPLASLHAGCWLPDVRPEERIGQVRAPVLVVHSRRDPLIPAEHGVRLHGRAGGTRARLGWLDALRGIAALCVVFDHLTYSVLQPVRDSVYHWFDPGQCRWNCSWSRYSCWSCWCAAG